MQPNIYSVTEHDLDQNSIDPDALFVLKNLQAAGFTAYLVGGSVRDLLLKRSPKDFDISTSARPEQIKALFPKNCLLIGRRFRLAHVRFGHKIIEVSTFRSGESDSDLILRDNQWGSPEEDVLRRDFTINGLFYDPASHSIIDYVGGWEDIHANVLKTIGNATIRFKQDPVRMIRLLKFRARFGFKVDPEARKALIESRQEILKSAPARVLEEILRMLESGSAAPFFNLLYESRLLSLLYPTLANSFEEDLGKELQRYLIATDKVNVTLGKHPLDRSILLAALLFPFLKHLIKTQYLDKQQTPHLGEVILATSNVFQEFEAAAFARIPKRLVAIATAILSNQYRMTPISGKKHYPRLFKSKDFNASLALLKIRALVDKDLIDTYTSWKTLHRQHLRQHEKKHHHHHSHKTHAHHEPEMAGRQSN